MIIHTDFDSKRLEGQLQSSSKRLTHGNTERIAVTSRLEDVAASQSSPAPTSSLKSPTSAFHEGIAGHVAAPAAAASAASAGTGSSSSEMTPAVKAYKDEIIDGTLATVLAKSKEIGGLVEQHVRSNYVHP